jgi:hypothetical protein
MILTNDEYGNFLTGMGYEYCGGIFRKMPARIKAPHGGEWNVVLNIGKHSQNIRNSISVTHK